MLSRRFVVTVAALLVAAALLAAAAHFDERTRLHALERRESDPNPLAARRVVGLRRSVRQLVGFDRVVVDGTTRRNGRKPKVIIDPDGHGAVVGAQRGVAGFALYRPGHRPAEINAYSGGPGAEDAQAADLDSDGMPDIVVGGLDQITFVLYNPRHHGCRDVYRCSWSRSVIDSTRPSHDVVVGDVGGSGRIDIVTESGVYFNHGLGRHWQFAGRALIARDGEGTSVGDLAGDGIPDIVAPYRSGRVLARFVNPRHHGGDPARDVWIERTIDPHPLFSGNMTTAIADINGDRRNDIVLAPMYGGGGLVWYEAPRRATSPWKRHLIDSTINFVHQGSLQIGDFGDDRHSSIAFAEQDQSPTRRVGIFYNLAGNGTRWRLQILSLDGGHNIKAGRLGPNRRLSIVTARHGYFGGANPLIAWESRDRSRR